MDKPKAASRWRPGQSGNVRGRPRGTAVAARLRDSIGDELPEIVDVLVRAAKQGDVNAARILLDRAIPALKPVEATCQVPITGDSLTAKAESILDAVARGAIAPGQAAILVAALGQVCRLIEIEQLEARLAALEQRRPHAIA